MDSTQNGCGGCRSGCSSHTVTEQATITENRLNQVKTVIAVFGSGGGMGTSLVTALLASSLARRGKASAILDADIANSAIPSMFGLSDRVVFGEAGLYPLVSAGGVKIMSADFLLERTDQPIRWRGPTLANVAVQFWTDVIWDEVDVLFVDMPSGTGDVPQVLLEVLPLAGAIVVTTPRQAALAMAARMIGLIHGAGTPVLGLLVNDLGHPRHVSIDEFANAHNIPVLDRLHFDPRLTTAADLGELERLEDIYLPNTISLIENM